MRLVALALSAALPGLAACTSASGPAPAQAPAAAPSTTRGTDALPGAIASTRSARGAPALRVSPALQAAARRHVDWIADTGAYGHRGAGGSRVGDRVSAQGYCWGALGENIAYGIPSREAALQGWLASPAHRRNLLLPRFTEYGLAGADGYWVMVLARPC